MGGVYSDMKVVYMCHGGFKNRALRERPLTKKGGGGAFRTGPHVKKGVLELKITKKHIFFKGGSFRAAQVENVESLGAAKAKNGGGGGGGLSRGTYPYCPNKGVPPPREHCCVALTSFAHEQTQ